MATSDRPITACTAAAAAAQPLRQGTPARRAGDDHVLAVDQRAVAVEPISRIMPRVSAGSKSASRAPGELRVRLEAEPLETGAHGRLERRGQRQTAAVRMRQADLPGMQHQPPGSAGRTGRGAAIFAIAQDRRAE